MHMISEVRMTAESEEDTTLLTHLLDQFSDAACQPKARVMKDRNAAFETTRECVF